MERCLFVKVLLHYSSKSFVASNNGLLSNNTNRQLFNSLNKWLHLFMSSRKALHYNATKLHNCNDYFHNFPLNNIQPTIYERCTTPSIHIAEYSSYTIKELWGKEIVKCWRTKKKKKINAQRKIFFKAE